MKMFALLFALFAACFLPDVQAKKCQEWCPETKPTSEELQTFVKCRSRADCKKHEVCCNFGSGCYCVLPKPKKGTCPSKYNDNTCFRNVCLTDYDCKGKEKCCGNGCLCAKPE